MLVAPFLGLSAGLVAGRDIETKTKTIPNQGIWKSLVNAGKSGLIIGVIGVLVFRLIGGLGLGLFIWLRVGGKACIQHLTLRLILHHNGYIPWNYARFLDYCTERMFLQRVGGRYRFIHKLLQDHFAQMQFER